MELNLILGTNNACDPFNLTNLEGILTHSAVADAVGHFLGHYDFAMCAVHLCRFKIDSQITGTYTLWFGERSKISY